MADDEILVENEPWTGLVVVRQHSRMAMREAGSYGLVQASEWHQDQHGPAVLTVWRGPEKPDEQIPRSDLEQEECQTVLVDAQGFYTCPPIIDLLREEVWKLAQELLQEEADRQAAQANSYLNDYYTDKYGEEIFIEASFGDAIAVNGDTVFSAKAARPPKGYVKLDEEGGRYPSGEESEIDLDYVYEQIVRQLGDKYLGLDEKTVAGIISKEADTEKRYVYWTSDSGYVNFWIPKKALKVYEKAEAERKRKEQEKSWQREEARRQETLKREKEAQDERERLMRRGGYPNPKDWSPKGFMP